MFDNSISAYTFSGMFSTAIFNRTLVKNNTFMTGQQFDWSTKIIINFKSDEWTAAAAAAWTISTTLGDLFFHDHIDRAPSALSTGDVPPCFKRTPSSTTTGAGHALSQNQTETTSARLAAAVGISFRYTSVGNRRIRRVAFACFVATDRFRFGESAPSSPQVHGQPWRSWRASGAWAPSSATQTSCSASTSADTPCAPTASKWRSWKVRVCSRGARELRLFFSYVCCYVRRNLNGHLRRRQSLLETTPMAKQMVEYGRGIFNLIVVFSHYRLALHRF